MENFYNSDSYKEKQSTIARFNWKKGIYDSLRKQEKRQCIRAGCGKVFETIPSDRKIFCSMECAARVNNEKRNVITHQRKEEIAKLYRDGLSMAEISESLGYGYGKAVYWMKKLNIPRRSYIPPMGKGTYKRKSEYGVLTVGVYNTKLKKIFDDWIENYRAKAPR